MTIIKIENRFDAIVRDCKNWSKGFCAGSAFTLGVIGYFAAKRKEKELEKEMKKEEL